MPYLQTHVVLEVDGDAGVVLPVLGEVVELVGVREHQHQHLVHDHCQPEPVQEFTPERIR